MTVLDLPVVHDASPAAGSPAPATLLLSGPPAFWLATSRRFVTEALLHADVDDDASGDVLVLLEDVVTQALQHAGTHSVTVAVNVEVDAVRVEVRERGSVVGFGEDAPAALDRTAERWGVGRRGRGTELWFRVARWHEVGDTRITA
ncbi:hypothetical protein ACXR2U_11630 [Jatrophihabitans sp. YIM 134969]